jgi:hypothetical protein
MMWCCSDICFPHFFFYDVLVAQILDELVGQGNGFPLQKFFLFHRQQHQKKHFLLKSDAVVFEQSLKYGKRLFDYCYLFE